MGFEIIKKQKLIGDENDDEFGCSVAISGDYCIVGDRFNERVVGFGAAFIYKRQYDGHWEQVQKLIGNENDDDFGMSVAISGDYCIVGDEDNNDRDDGGDGAAFIYKRQYDGHWEQVQKLIGNENDDEFGMSVAIDGDYCIVGDIRNARPEQGGDTNPGAAFIYKRQYDGHWKQVQKLIGNENDVNFGFSVAIDGDYCIVGDDRPEAAEGAAFIYKRDYNGHWKQVQTLIGDENDGSFGESVALSGKYCIVGDSKNERPEQGGDAFPGAAFIYKRQYNGYWKQVQKLIGDENDITFGGSVAINGDYCIVGDSEDDGAVPPGSAFIYKRDYDGHWKQVQKLTGDDNDEDFGISVAIDGKHFMAGDLDNNSRGAKQGVAFIHKFR